MANERTSKKIAKLAAKILAANPPDNDIGNFWTHGSTGTFGVTGAELKALAASCLTQTADTPKRKPARKTK